MISDENDDVSLRVLVVDDNVDTADSLAMLIETFGHRSSAAYDGLVAVKEAFARRPNVVLLDIALPGLNGYEIARRIRREPELEQVVLVAVTGYGQDEDRDCAFGAGFDYHLTKPIDLDLLQAILAAVPKNCDVSRPVTVRSHGGAHA